MADVITRTLSRDLLDPDVMKLATPILRRWEAAARGVATSHVDSAIKLPAGADTPESILSERFREVTNARPDAPQRAGQRNNPVAACATGRSTLAGLVWVQTTDQETDRAA